MEIISYPIDKQVWGSRLWVGVIAAAALGMASCSGELPDGRSADTGTNRPAENVLIIRAIGTTRGPFMLGEPLRKSLVPEYSSGDTVVVVTASIVSGVDRIYFHLAHEGIVRQIVMDYSRLADYERIVRDMTKQSGAPVRSRPSRRGEEPRDEAVWRDASTEFRIVRDPNRSAWTVRSVMTDLKAPAQIR